MRTFDFSPFTRSTIGFENVFDRLNNLPLPENGNGYPPYDIVRTGDDTFRISLAVAGFSPNEISTAIRGPQTLDDPHGERVTFADNLRHALEAYARSGSGS